MSSLDEGLSLLTVEQMTTISASTALVSIPAEARVAVIQAETQGLRVGTAADPPTDTVGFIIADGDDLTIHGKLERIRIMQDTAGAIANIMYLR